ncbi:hypothetical protein [Pseudophaeobacter flagellatus]|uniref:hypothetical protein n=1 Tax=Pseudophaeobacter flagellatus TaxID=2899119 RepID=UPI001E4A3ADE|nr:hypothetical protein [Pseudophaeobacter flagellatus]MCD9149818.1 hypothetical protein [Pseudophaeobacter flagellatus]
MRVVVSYKIKNKITIDTPFVVQHETRAYHLARDEGEISEVSVIFTGQDVGNAPTFTSGDGGNKIPKISVKDNYSLLAERDIRSWQSILAPYQCLDIDFSTKETAYHAETTEEQEAIKLKTFKIETGEYKGPSSEDFSLYGRAFLAIPKHYDTIAKTAFYIEGVHHLKSGHCIDAYNLFYLYLEANFNLPFKMAAAKKSLMGNPEFQRALKQQAKDKTWHRSDVTLTLEGISAPEYDAEKLTKSIIKLRGHLRHNTLSNPNRWDPHNQDKHRQDAVFLSGVCQSLASPIFSTTFEPEYADEFLRLAQEKKHMTKINVTITIKDLASALPHDIHLDMNIPTVDDTPNLAKTAMENALQYVNENAPGADLYAIRANLSPRGVELFRYDLGPSIGRK